MNDLVRFLREARPQDVAPSGLSASEIVDAIAADMIRFVAARRARGYDCETAA